LKRSGFQSRFLVFKNDGFAGEIGLFPESGSRIQNTGEITGETHHFSSISMENA